MSNIYYITFYIYFIKLLPRHTHTEKHIYDKGVVCKIYTKKLQLIKLTTVQQ